MVEVQTHLTFKEFDSYVLQQLKKDLQESRASFNNLLTSNQQQISDMEMHYGIQMKHIRDELSTKIVRERRQTINQYSQKMIVGFIQRQHMISEKVNEVQNFKANEFNSFKQDHSDEIRALKSQHLQKIESLSKTDLAQEQVITNQRKQHEQELKLIKNELTGFRKLKSVEQDSQLKNFESQIGNLIFKQIQEMKLKEKQCDERIIDMVEKNRLEMKTQATHYEKQITDLTNTHSNEIIKMRLRFQQSIKEIEEHHSQKLESLREYHQQVKNSIEKRFNQRLSDKEEELQEVILQRDTYKKGSQEKNQQVIELKTKQTDEYFQLQEYRKKYDKLQHSYKVLEKLSTRIRAQMLVFTLGNIQKRTMKQSLIEIGKIYYIKKIFKQTNKQREIEEQLEEKQTIVVNLKSELHYLYTQLDQFQNQSNIEIKSLKQILDKQTAQLTSQKMLSDTQKEQLIYLQRRYDQLKLEYENSMHNEKSVISFNPTITLNKSQSNDTTSQMSLSRPVSAITKNVNISVKTNRNREQLKTLDGLKFLQDLNTPIVIDQNIKERSFEQNSGLQRKFSVQQVSKFRDEQAVSPLLLTRKLLRKGLAISKNDLNLTQNRDLLNQVSQHIQRDTSNPSILNKTENLSQPRLSKTLSRPYSQENTNSRQSKFSRLSNSRLDTFRQYLQAFKDTPQEPISQTPLNQLIEDNLKDLSTSQSKSLQQTSIINNSQSEAFAILLQQKTTNQSQLYNQQSINKTGRISKIFHDRNMSLREENNKYIVKSKNTYENQIGFGDSLSLRDCLTQRTLMPSNSDFNQI
eukprot:403340828